MFVLGWFPQEVLKSSARKIPSENPKLRGLEPGRDIFQYVNREGTVWKINMEPAPTRNFIFQPLIFRGCSLVFREVTLKIHLEISSSIHFLEVGARPCRCTRPPKRRCCGGRSAEVSRGGVEMGGCRSSADWDVPMTYD